MFTFNDSVTEFLYEELQTFYKPYFNVKYIRKLNYFKYGKMSPKRGHQRLLNISVKLLNS